MVYTTPVNFISNNPLTAVQLNLMQDNIRALKDPPSAGVEINEASNYTTTNTSFEDVDATEGKFKHTIVTKGGVVLIGMALNVTNAGTGVAFELDIDGSPHYGEDGFGAADNVTAAPGLLVAPVLRIEGLSAASHIFKLQWKILTTGTGTLYAGAGTTDGDLHPTFWVAEAA